MPITGTCRNPKPFKEGYIYVKHRIVTYEKKVFFLIYPIKSEMCCFRKVGMDTNTKSKMFGKH